MFLSASVESDARIQAKTRVDVVADFFAGWNLRNEEAFRGVAEVCDEIGFLAGAEARAIVGVGEPAPEFGDEFGRPAGQRANLSAGLTVTDRTGPVGDMNRDCVRSGFALRAVTRFTAHSGAGAIEDDFEAEIGVRDAAL